MLINGRLNMGEKNIRVLLVDDKQADRMALLRMVEEKGLSYEVETAGTVSKAKELIGRGGYDIALLDYMLPDGSGLELLEIIKDFPAVFLTGSGDETVAVKAMKGGAYDYIIKDNDNGYLEPLPQLIEKVIRSFRIEQKHRLAQEHLIKLNQELVRLYEETRSLSLTDPLTGLSNRRRLLVEIERDIERAKRYGHPLSVIMIDIDHFKRFNDEHGHLDGDRVLIDVARLISGVTRSSDLAVRYGGEEFLILLSETNLENACTLAEKIRGTIEKNTPVTVSLGVSSCRRDTRDYEEFLKDADKALYRAKEKGRNSIETSAAEACSPEKGVKEGL